MSVRLLEVCTWGGVLLGGAALVHCDRTDPDTAYADGSADAAAAPTGASSSGSGSAGTDAAGVVEAGAEAGPTPSTGFPNATNTGFTHAPGYPGALTPWDGRELVDGQTYSFFDFPGGLDVGSREQARSAITFVGCRFHGVGEKLVALYGDDITFDHCTFEPEVAPAQNVSYEQSYQYAIAGNGGYYTHVEKLTVLTGNTFSTGIQSVYGPLYPDDFWTQSGSIWQGNKWSVPTAAAYGDPAHDGWYWVPGAGCIDDESNCVSQSDYQP